MMADLILPDPRIEMPELFEPGRKPIGLVEINLDHDLAQGLRAAYFFQNAPNDKPAGKFTIRPSISGAVGFDPSIGSNFVGSGELIAETGVNLAMQDFTIVAGGFFPTPGAVSAVYSRMVTGTTTGADSHLTILTDRRLRFYGALPSNVTIDSTDAYSANDYTTLAWIRDNNQGTFAIDGVYDSGGWQTCSLYNNGSLRTSVGSNGSNLSQRITAKIKFLLLFDIVKQPGELKRLHHDPYQFLIPA